MKSTVRLIETLKRVSSDEETVDLLQQYFSEHTKENNLFLVALLLGKRPKKVITLKELISDAIELANIPDWLYIECLQMVNDVGETISLIVPQIDNQEENYDLAFWMNKLNSLSSLSKTNLKSAVKAHWGKMTTKEISLYNSLLSSTFRFILPANLLAEALAQTYNVNKYLTLEKLLTNWLPHNLHLDELLKGKKAEKIFFAPRQFIPIEEADQTKLIDQDILQYCIEPYWDGVSIQLIYFNGLYYIWNKRGELLTNKLPELTSLNTRFNSFILYGYLMATSKVEQSLTNQELVERRCKRRKLTKKQLLETSIYFKAFDCLQLNNEDLTDVSLDIRRDKLAKVVKSFESDAIQFSNSITANSWQIIEQIIQSRANQNSNGVLVRHWQEKLINNPITLILKPTPFYINAALTYATKSETANNYTDYTFGIWSGKELVTVFKVAVNETTLDTESINKVIKASTIEKFGPVVQLKPSLIFTISFENVYSSNRHKSGLKFSQVKIVKQIDCSIEQVNSLEEILRFL